MSDILSHRGPDGEAQWINDEGNTGFAMRRLAILDLSNAGNQPMHYQHCTLVFNGEIYNYVELKKTLQQKGYTFKGESDTEVLAAMYACYGKECLQYLDGMFAFAVWDQKEKYFFAARDRFGEKPFFYSFGNDQLLFASEMKALWSAGSEKTVNRKMLFNFLSIGYTDNPNDTSETFYEHIYKLPPAHFLCYKPGEDELSIERYWDIELDTVSPLTDENEIIAQFREMMKASVMRRLRSDVAVGTSLSGGVDSASIAALCESINSTNFTHKCFTATFPGYEKDESEKAAEVVKAFGLEAFQVTPDSIELIESMEKLMFHHEEPFGSASIFMQFKVYELAAKNQVKVLLDGQGADEILAGYHKYYKWYWQELFSKRKLYKSGEVTAARKNNVDENFGLKNVMASLFPDFATVFLERRYLLNALQHEGLTKEFVKLQSREAYYTTPTVSGLNGILYFNTIIHGLEELLRYADRNSMAHSREVRLPFLDHKLVEFIFSLPSKYKIRNGWTKWILRQSMTELPKQIAWQQNKIGFEPPQKLWMGQEEVKQSIHEGKKKLVKVSRMMLTRLKVMIGGTGLPRCCLND